MIQLLTARSLGDLLAQPSRLLAWSRAAVSVHATRSVASVLLLLSALSLVGWSMRIAWLVQPFRLFPAFGKPAALGVLLVGGSLLATSTARGRWLSVAMACAAMFVGTLPLQEMLGWHLVAATLGDPVALSEATERVGAAPHLPLTSALFLLLGGAGVLAIVSRRRGLWSSITLAATGGIMMLLATTVLAGHAMGFLQGAAFSRSLGSSLQVSIGAILLATHFNAMAWTKQAGFAPPPAWLPVSAVAGSLLTVLLVWRALLTSEEAQLMEQTRVAALASRSSVNRQMLDVQRSLRRMARYGFDSDSNWSAAATQMVEDVHGLETLLWVNASGVPRAADGRASAAKVAAVQTALRTRLPSLTRVTASAWFVPLVDDPSRSLMVVPRCTGGRCTELVVGVLNSATVLGSVLSDTVLGFEMAIGDSAGWFRASGPMDAAASRYAVREPLNANAPGWQLAVWPSARLASGTPSTLSDVVLVLGLVVSVLLGVTLRLAQSVSQTARLDERASLNLALRSTTDGLWEWDLHTGEVTRSPELWTRLGYGIGANHRRMQDWLALVHPQDLPKVEASLNDHLQRRAESFDAQYRVRSAGGRWHQFVDRGRVVHRTANGAPLRLIGVFADVTDKRNIEESLRQTENSSTMGRLAARIAHEINNPLAGIQNAFRLIKDAVPRSHPHIKYVSAIEREIERISLVTRQLYEQYRPEAEVSANAPVHAVISDAVAFLEQLNRAANVSIHVDLGEAATVVRMSDNLLRQCVCNLVQNAIEASHAGAAVFVSGEIVDDEFELRVRDTGPGVPRELRDAIFDPFVSTKTSALSTGGIGLGLSLVRRALNAAGGGIEVVDAPGGGAEFIARIPLAVQSVSGGFA